MSKINISDISNDLANEMGLSKQTAQLYTSKIFDMIKEHIENGDEVNIMWFGKFKMKITAPRKGYNVKTGDHIDIPSKHRISFEMSRNLKKIYDDYDSQNKY